MRFIGGREGEEREIGGEAFRFSCRVRTDDTSPTSAANSAGITLGSRSVALVQDS